MAAEVNYKSKYMELRAKYMSDLDMAFRLGMEQGIQQEQQNQTAQAQAQADQMSQLSAQNGQAEGAQEDTQEESKVSEHPSGSELDQHIAKLESLLGKSEINPEDLQKSVSELKILQKNIKLEMDLKKSAQAIKGIVKALHKPAHKLGVQASHNLNSSAKQAVSLQHKIVNDVLNKMEEEERHASKSIKDILNIEGLIHKE